MVNGEDPQAPFSAELVPFPVADRLPGVPSPAEVRASLLESFNRAVQRERDQRGEVVGQETVWPMVRAVEGFRDLVNDYSRVFKAVGDTAKDVLEEELFSVRQEQDGIPMGSLSVPAGGSTINVKAKTANRHDIDRDQVIAALAALVSDEWTSVREANHFGPLPAEEPEQFAMEVARRALDMVGAAELKVTQVRALAVQLGQVGADSLSAVVSDAIRTTKLYKGVAVERKAS